MKKNVSRFLLQKAKSLVLVSSLLAFALACSTEKTLKPENQNSNSQLNIQQGNNNAVSTVLWKCDVNKPYLESVYALNTEPGEPASATTATDAVYGKVWVINKPKDSKRAEFSRATPKNGTASSYVPSEGSKVYIGWRWKMKIEGSTNPSGGMAVFQNKSVNNGTQNYPFILDYNGTTLEMATYTQQVANESQASRRKVIWSKAVPEDTWYAIVIGVNFSKDKTKGTIELWINGSKQDLVGDDASKILKFRTLDDEGNYPKWGAYNNYAKPFNVTAYISNLKIASNYEDSRP